MPDHLKRLEKTLSPGDSCDNCGGALKSLGEDVTEERQYVPGHFVVKRIVGPRMTCTCCEAFAQAELISRPITRGSPGSGLLAHVKPGQITLPDAEGDVETTVFPMICCVCSARRLVSLLHNLAMMFVRWLNLNCKRSEQMLLARTSKDRRSRIGN
tara:strand:- start:154 stop:621 length:468 start_codon:yes stop_codon:yes gene_type:complete